MNYLSKYEIAFKGLKEGHHDFEFEIDDKFFEQFENSEVSKGELIAEVKLTKQSTLMILNIAVNGKVELQCDRCLENYFQKVKNQNKLYIKFGHETEEMTDEIIVLSFDEYQINVAYYLYELIILGLPIKHVHPDKKGKTTCDPEMVEKLKEYLVDQVSPSNEDEDVIDDRWSELKKLLDNK